MKLEGSRVLPAGPADVWALLTDPKRLPACLPGCERLEPAGENRYRVVLQLGLAAISGSYSGSVELAEMEPPKSFRMRIEGKGTGGFVKGEGRIELAAKAGETEVRYAGQAQVGGVIAAVGQRMLDAAAKRMVQQFFDCAAKQLEAARPAADGSAGSR